MKKACGKAHMKSILAVGELGSLENIYKASFVAMMAGSDFIKTFGNPNPIKKNRYSWSGSCVPSYNNWNSNGQILTINENNDIII